jgi:hypothetical protein
VPELLKAADQGNTEADGLFGTREEIRYYLDIQTGNVLWYELRSSVVFPPSLMAGVAVKRGQVTVGQTTQASLPVETSRPR